jgi:hypothetical protein
LTLSPGATVTVTPGELTISAGKGINNVLSIHAMTVQVPLRSCVEKVRRPLSAEAWLLNVALTNKANTNIPAGNFVVVTAILIKLNIAILLFS